MKCLASDCNWVGMLRRLPARAGLLKRVFWTQQNEPLFSNPEITELGASKTAAPVLSSSRNLVKHPGPLGVNRPPLGSVILPCPWLPALWANRNKHNKTYRESVNRNLLYSPAFGNGLDLQSIQRLWARFHWLWPHTHHCDFCPWGGTSGLQGTHDLFLPCFLSIKWRFGERNKLWILQRITWV